jgi:hypothetical protein
MNFDAIPGTRITVADVDMKNYIGFGTMKINSALHPEWSQVVVLLIKDPDEDFTEDDNLEADWVLLERVEQDTFDLLQKTLSKALTDSEDGEVYTDSAIIDPHGVRPTFPG